MPFHNSRYSLLSATEDEPPLEKQSSPHLRAFILRRFLSDHGTAIAVASLLISLVINFALVLDSKTLGSASQVATSHSSHYGMEVSSIIQQLSDTYLPAGLQTNIERAFRWNTAYSGENGTEVERLWYEDIPWESGIMALENSEAEHMGLPRSQPFPWDAKHKSLYIVNGHHILHCVVGASFFIPSHHFLLNVPQRNLYISINEYRHHKAQSINFSHILHCLDTIRVETLCNADDTPRYVPLNGKEGLMPGEGQIRMCKDWDQLERWVQGHDSCYRYIEPGNDEISNLERFKYCANDSPYLPVIRKHFGYEDSWLPREEVN